MLTLARTIGTTGPIGQTKDRFWVNTLLTNLETADPLPIFDLLEVNLPTGRKIIYEEIEDPGPALQNIPWCEWGLITTPEGASVLLLKIASGTALAQGDLGATINCPTNQEWLLSKMSAYLAALDKARKPPGQTELEQTDKTVISVPSSNNTILTTSKSSDYQNLYDLGGNQSTHQGGTPVAPQISSYDRNNGGRPWRQRYNQNYNQRYYSHRRSRSRSRSPAKSSRRRTRSRTRSRERISSRKSRTPSPKPSQPSYAQPGFHYGGQMPGMFPGYQNAWMQPNPGLQQNPYTGQWQQQPAFTPTDCTPPKGDSKKPKK